MDEGFLKSPLPALNDKEGHRVPDRFHRVIDSHVHLFPDKLFDAVRNWFDEFGWPIRYREDSRTLLEFLLSRGISHVIAFQYAHKAGMASSLNAYMIDIIKSFEGKVTGLATVFPGEKNDVAILEDAFAAGLKGVKLHVHVQCFDLNGPAMEAIYDCCSRNKKPMVIHAGREPKSPAYACDPYELCCWKYVEEVIKAFPDLKLCVPHLAMNELREYAQLLENYDNLWLDTAMALTDYLPKKEKLDLRDLRLDRIMYGSDFPNIPFAWDRELVWLDQQELSPEQLDAILWKNAATFFNISEGLNSPYISRGIPKVNHL